MPFDKTNLIVNYIPNSLTEDDVRTMFECLGEVASCKLIKNKITGKSLGYAFVNYVTEESARSAVDALSGTELQDKRLKVSFASVNKNKAKNNNLYVANLPPSINEDKLLELFNAYGPISSHKILTNQDGSSKGAGFVMYGSKEDADRAIEEMSGKKFEDSTIPLMVKYAAPPASKDQTGSLNSITTSSLVGLGVASRVPNVRYNPLAGRPQAQTAASLINPSLLHAQTAASLINPSLLHAQTAASLINPSLLDAQTAASLINPSLLDAQTVMLNSSLNASLNPVANAISVLNAHVAQNSGGAFATASPTTVYIYGLQPTHTELTLYELFSPFGAILNVRLIRDTSKDDKPCKGYGFVNFTKMEDAYLAITSLNGVPFEEKVLQVSIKQSKDTAAKPVQLNAANPYGTLIGFGMA